MIANITRFVGHEGNHFDEFAGAKQLRAHGERFWGPEVRTATWHFVDDPGKYRSKDLIEKGYLPIGTCGPPYDEHGIPDARKKFVCATRLVYDHLDIANNPSLTIHERASWQSFVRYAMYADCRTGIDWQALPTLIKRRWGLWFDYEGPVARKQEMLRELVWRCERDVDDFLDDTLVFWQALYAVKDTLERRPIKVGGKDMEVGIIRGDNPVTDNRQVKNALTSRRWQVVTKTACPHVVFKRGKNGQVGIFMTSGAGLDLSEVEVGLRLLEMERRGIVHNLTLEELLREKCELCPWWHWMEGSQTILNGSKDSARGVECTRLTDTEILAVLESKLRLKVILTSVDDVTHPEQIELPGPVEAMLKQVPGPMEEVVMLIPGEDGVVQPAYV